MRKSKHVYSPIVPEIIPYLKAGIRVVHNGDNVNKGAMGTIINVNSHPNNVLHVLTVTIRWVGNNREPFDSVVRADFLLESVLYDYYDICGLDTVHTNPYRNYMCSEQLALYIPRLHFAKKTQHQYKFNAEVWTKYVSKWRKESFTVEVGTIEKSHEYYLVMDDVIQNNGKPYKSKHGADVACALLFAENKKALHAKIFACVTEHKRELTTKNFQA